ncbi:MAG TPA: ubiquitin-like small modifier protein 2 [Halobacteriales archaeon]|nr:ubiquitin-like small modifier protein 2 [Halobacteriales archaeon]
MRVTVSVAGSEDREIAVDGEDATYADLLAEVDLSPQEAAVLVDGRPVPEDAPVEAERVEILRLIQGG